MGFRVLAVCVVLVVAACTPSVTRPEAHSSVATITAAPSDTGTCAPERLARCIPELAAISGFDEVHVFAPRPGFAYVPPSTYRDAASDYCKELPRLTTDYRPGVDVDYRPANGVESVYLRLLAASGDDLDGAMAAWDRQCPWAVAKTVQESDIQVWQVAQDADELSRYRAGDVAYQWPGVTHFAAAVLPNGVLVQAWYRTDDPSEDSRNQLLRQIVRAAGHPPARTSFPAEVDDWSRTQLATLLPPLAEQRSIAAGPMETNAALDAPGNRYWSLCAADNGPRSEPLATWWDWDPAKWDRSDGPPRPFVMIRRVEGDYLADLRQAIAACAATLADSPGVCSDRANLQSLESDSVVIEGEDAVRFTHRWLRTVDARGHELCSEGVEAMTVTQVDGLIVVGCSNHGAYDAPAVDVLDELAAETVRRIKTG